MAYCWFNGMLIRCKCMTLANTKQLWCKMRATLPCKHSLTYNQKKWWWECNKKLYDGDATKTSTMFHFLLTTTTTTKMKQTCWQEKGKFEKHKIGGKGKGHWKTRRKKVLGKIKSSPREERWNVACNKKNQNPKP